MQQFDSKMIFIEGEVVIVVEILRSIGIIARSLDSISNIEFKKYNLTKGQYLYLVRIYENPGIIQEKLAEMIKVDKTTAARAIKKLENNDFIVRKQSSDNKKEKKLYVTKKGKEVYPTIYRENIYSNKMALKGLSPAEQRQIFELLKVVEDNVASDWEYVKKGNHRQY
ncbi:MarR family transcriptional regulator [Companilactobacillus alimentarius DSM 20249]|nr:MarR family transcriptional regulator [Companilactobacillus alimentarius DSM 20249]